MKKFKVCLAVLMIAMMMGGSAWAWNAVDHVKVAPNGKGDLLIFPWYFAYPGGYSTKITVTNTSNSQSVVAKVVYRSYNWSYELLDHLIILSPNDVWTGTLVNVNGVARLQSTDDSILGRQPSGNAADEDFGNITPVDVPLGLPGCPVLAAPPPGYIDDVNTLGYIEVIEAAARTECVIGTCSQPTGYAPGTRVAKRHIYDWYLPLSSSDIASNFLPVNVLTGYQENTFGGSSTLKQANVFSDYNNFDKLTISTPTRLGQNAYNTLAELEAAMGKLNVALPYIAKPNGDSSVHIFNFPTKLSQYGVGSTCTNYVPYNLNGFSQSPYWMQVISRCEVVTTGIYDLLENRSTSRYPFSPLPSGAGVCPEVELTFVLYNNPVYTEGWIRYNWNQSANLKTALSRSGDPIAYYGTPVLPSVMYWSATRTNPVEAHAAYDDGPVFNDGVGRVRLPYYQYSD